MAKSSRTSSPEILDTAQRRRPGSVLGRGQLLHESRTWLKPGGQLIAHLDMHNIRHGDGRDASRAAASLLRAQGVEIDSRRGWVRLQAPIAIAGAWRYLGADDSAGPNRTGQDAVHSCYAF
jgi:hypothetical protein